MKQYKTLIVPTAKLVFFVLIYVGWILFYHLNLPVFSEHNNFLHSSGLDIVISVLIFIICTGAIMTSVGQILRVCFNRKNNQNHHD